MTPFDKICKQCGGLATVETRDGRNVIYCPACNYTGTIQEVSYDFNPVVYDSSSDEAIELNEEQVKDYHNK